MPVKKKTVKPAAKTAAKPAVKKTKTAVKKHTVKKPAKAEVSKKSLQDYKDVINWKKWEAHNINQLCIEINAGDLLTELEAGVDNLETCCNAVMDCMLEGDRFVVEPEEKNGVADTLTVRYYCDNLSEDRKKYSGQ